MRLISPEARYHNGDGPDNHSRDFRLGAWCSDEDSEHESLDPNDSFLNSDEKFLETNGKYVKLRQQNVEPTRRSGGLDDEGRGLGEMIPDVKKSVVKGPIKSINEDRKNTGDEEKVFPSSDSFLQAKSFLKLKNRAIGMTIGTNFDDDNTLGDPNQTLEKVDEHVEELSSSPTKRIKSAKVQALGLTIPKRRLIHRLVDPKDPLFRNVVLLLTCFPLLAAYYSYDIVAALSSQIKTDFNLTNAEFSQLYTVYEIPNIFMPFVAGAILDRIGVRLSTVLFTATILLGVSVTTAGPYCLSFPLMLFGRALYGIGSESMQVGMDLIYSRWFVGRGLSFAVGLGTTAGRLGDVLAFNVGTLIASYCGDYRVSLLSGTILTVIGLAATIAYYFMDRIQEERNGYSPHISVTRSPKRSNSIFPADTPRGDEQNVPLTGNDRTKRTPPLVLHLKDVLHQVASLPSQFWLIAVVDIMYYSTYFPFQAFAPTYIERKWSLPPDEAARITGIMALMSMILCPVAGLLIDRVGRRATAVTISGSVMLFALILLAFTQVSPAVCTALIGIAFCVIPAAVWSALAIVIPSDQQAIAFGLITAMFNTGLTISYYAVGLVADNLGDSLTAVPILLCMVLLVGIVTSVVWNVVDKKSGGLANLTDKDLRKVRESQEGDVTPM